MKLNLGGSRGARASSGGRHALLRRLSPVLVAAVLVGSGGTAAFAARPPSEGGRADDIHSANVSLLANLRVGSSTDISFWHDLAVVGTGVVDDTTANDGFVLVAVGDPAQPREISRFTCPNSGYDVSIWEDLVILSAETPAPVAGCSAFAPDFAPRTATADLLVVDVSDPAEPALAGAVLSECGSSHTHTLHPVPREQSLVVYTSGLGCVAPVVVPLRDPGAAEGQPQLQGFGTDVADGSATCHDITVFVDERIAACAASTAGTELWDVSEPLAPRLVSRILNPVLEHHHSTAFSWDGDTLVIGEEKVSTFATDVCTDGTGTPLGALWFYDIEDLAQPRLRSWFQVPRAGTDGYCSAHYFNVVPRGDGRDVLVSGWYRGGTTMVDFTDPGAPREIGYYKASPGDAEDGSMVYSAYWYNGFVYATNFGGEVVPGDGFGSRRGLDVLAVEDEAFRGAASLPYLNAQTQMWGGGAGRGGEGVRGQG